MMTASLSDRPQALNDLEFTPPSGEGQKWTVYAPESGRILRLGYGAVRLLQRLDGDRSIDQLVDDAPSGSTPESLSTLLGSFREMGLLAGSAEEGAAEVRPRRLIVDGPFRVRLVLFERPRWLAPGSVLSRLAGLAGVRIAGLVVALSGLIALQANRTAVGIAATSRPTWVEALFVVGLVVTINWLHELAHGATLAAAGFVPRRLGLMLLYLYPAMFCDVTDAWRLRQRSQRVAVLLAGPLFQGALAGIMAVLALLVGGTSRTVLLLAAVVTYLMTVGNLIPFLKLDGYFALSAHLDIPNLQHKAIGDLTRLVRRSLAGRWPSRRELPAGWTLFGLASVLFPALIIGRLLIMVRPLLIASGRFGSVLWLAGVAVVLALTARSLGRQWGRIPRTRRLGVGAAALVVLLGAGVASSRITRDEVTVGALVGLSGENRLLIPDSHLLTVPEIGDEVEMITTGLLGQSTVGSATVIGSPEPRQASIGLLLPVRGIETRIPMTSVELQITDGDPGQATHGVVVVGSRSLAAVVGEFLVGDAIESLRTE